MRCPGRQPIRGPQPSAACGTAAEAPQALPQRHSRVAPSSAHEIDAAPPPQPTQAGAAPGGRLSRRGAAAAAAAAACSLLLGAHPPPPAKAENGPLPKSCGVGGDGAAAAGTTAGGLLVPYTDSAGRFRLGVPCGWRQVTSLLPGSSVLASFYNPEEPGAETLAVYAGPPPEGVRTTADLGSPQEFASRLASVAPNGIVQDAYGITHGGLPYLVAHVQFGGNTAGMFGSAREFRAVTIREGQQYMLRVTTTRYRYLALPEVRQWIRGAADAFQLLLP